MRNRLALMAAAMALAAPSAGMPDLVIRRQPGGDVGDWFKANGKGGKRAKNWYARDPSKLQLCGWSEVPCEAPTGYFWKRDASGKRKYRLYRSPPSERTVEYDERFDRSIIHSG